MMKRIAVIAAVLDNPAASQADFNKAVAEFRGAVKGRMGIPSPEHDLSMIAIIVQGSMDEINDLTGRLGALPGVSAKTAVSKREIDTEEGSAT